MLKNILLVVQIILAVCLATFILLQQKGSGVGSAFGGESVVYRSKRGVEKMLHYGTIAAAILLALVSFYSVVIG